MCVAEESFGLCLGFLHKGFLKAGLICDAGSFSVKDVWLQAHGSLNWPPWMQGKEATVGHSQLGIGLPSTRGLLTHRAGPAGFHRARTWMVKIPQ